MGQFPYRIVGKGCQGKTLLSLSYAYNASSLVTKASGTSGAGSAGKGAAGSSLYSYSPLNQLTASIPSPGPATPRATTYAYDPAGNLTSVSSGIPSGGSQGQDSQGQGTRSVQLAYDAASQLTGLTLALGQSTQTAGFTYNPQGQRASETIPGAGKNAPSTTLSYGYTAAGELASYSGPAGGAPVGIQSVTGTPGQKGDAGQGSENAKGRAPSPVTETYGYTGDGLLSSVTAGGSTQQLTWDMADGMPLLIAKGSTAFVTGPGGLPLEEIPLHGGPLYYLQGQRGSTRVLMDGTGHAVARYTYTPYGSLVASCGQGYNQQADGQGCTNHGSQAREGDIQARAVAANPFLFAGQYLDSTSGLYYMRARWYDPATAQFLTVDPLVAITGQLFAYVMGDPINLGDPLGLGWLGSPGWTPSTLPTVDNTELGGILKALYRPQSTFGDGSAMAALQNEAETGVPVNKWHARSVQDRLNQLNKVIMSGKLCPQDLAVAQQLGRYMEDSLYEWQQAGGNSIITRYNDVHNILSAFSWLPPVSLGSGTLAYALTSGAVGGAGVAGAAADAEAIVEITLLAA